jgi:hypothetical protein
MGKRNNVLGLVQCLKAVHTVSPIREWTEVSSS